MKAPFWILKKGVNNNRYAKILFYEPIILQLIYIYWISI